MESAMKKRFWIICLLMAGVTPLSLAAQTMAGLEVQKKADQASHQGTGKVVSVDRAKLRIKLVHDPIESLGWSGMTMDFRVAKASLLDGLKAGDLVRFELRHLKPEEIAWVIAQVERR